MIQMKTSVSMATKLSALSSSARAREVIDRKTLTHRICQKLNCNIGDTSIECTMCALMQVQILSNTKLLYERSRLGKWFSKAKRRSAFATQLRVFLAFHCAELNERAGLHFATRAQRPIQTCDLINDSRPSKEGPRVKPISVAR